METLQGYYNQAFWWPIWFFHASSSNFQFRHSDGTLYAGIDQPREYKCLHSYDHSLTFRKWSFTLDILKMRPTCSPTITFNLRHTCFPKHQYKKHWHSILDECTHVKAQLALLSRVFVYVCKYEVVKLK